MEELIKYFENTETRIAQLERRCAEYAGQIASLEQSVSELNNVLGERDESIRSLSATVAALSARVAAIEERPAESHSASPVPAAKVEDTERVAVESESAQPTLADDENVAIDDETGLPELEVEIVEEPESDEPEEQVAPEPVEKSDEPQKQEVEHAEQHQPTQTILDAAQREDTLSSIVPRVEDIKKAISLGDRFLFQRELFAGNGEQMNKTIEYLNGLSSLEEALKYIEKFGWNKDSNAYELFTNILKRRW